MIASAQMTFKVASEEREFEQVHELNYSTFVEEIPQHEVNPDRRLVDKYHSENAYLIALRGEELVGMMALRDRRPFSLDLKLGNLDSYLPKHKKIVEIRLLSIKPGHRNGVVFKGLGKLLFRYCAQQRYDLAVVSATVRQRKLYDHLGFVEFGPMVGTEETPFQPMYLTPESFGERARIFAPSAGTIGMLREPVNLLPGPVGIAPDVREAFGRPPVSHRADGFKQDFQHVKQLLCDLTGSRRVEILLGSGTLANDAIAGQLSLRSGRGMVLSNGEFGDRLIDHATRAGLQFDVVRAPWGEPLSHEEVARAIETRPDIEWLWAVHCETSSGLLNDLEGLQRLCDEKGIALCADCISSIGTIPVDLSRVHMASGVSGKGLGAFPGLCMVFYNHEILPSKTLPRYLDLGLYAVSDGIPFTHSSNLLYAMQAAVERVKASELGTAASERSSWLRAQLHELGMVIVGSGPQTSPVVTSIALPDALNSVWLGSQLEEKGYLLSYKSEYLVRRNWIQICTMGENAPESLEGLLSTLRDLCAQPALNAPA